MRRWFHGGAASLPLAALRLYGRQIRRIALSAAFLVWGAALCAAEPRRSALVIGNAAYSGALSPLSNPVNDAAAIAALLKSHGFEVLAGYDLPWTKFLDLLDEFREKFVPGANEIIVFYAGHGMALADDNILAPVNLAYDCETGEAHRAIKLSELFSKISAAPNQIVILDACRNDPFRHCRKRSGASGSGFRGFEPVADEGSRRLVATSTSLGALAADGDAGEHSPYVSAFLREAATQPDLPYYDLLERIVGSVRKATKNAQTPKLEADIRPSGCLARPCAGASAGIWPVSPPARLEPGACAPGEARLSATARCIRPGSGDSFRDCPQCPEMAPVPAGQFTMGSPPHEAHRSGAEGPQHDVRFAQPFAIGKFEVTVAEWAACAAAKRCETRSGDDRAPVVNVSWEDVTHQYLPWLRETSGHDYRLLSEAEWEYAARAGAQSPYATGMSIDNEQAHFTEYRRRFLKSVGGFTANGWGLHDMHGNAGEWVEDCWRDNYSDKPQKLKADGGAWIAPSCERRVWRGGAYTSFARDVRSARRFSDSPRERSYYLGFRVGRSLAP